MTTKYDDKAGLAEGIARLRAARNELCQSLYDLEVTVRPTLSDWDDAALAAYDRSKAQIMASGALINEMLARLESELGESDHS